MMSSKNNPFHDRNRLRELREQRHLTVAQLAKFLQLTPASYYRLERGADVKLTYALQLAKFYAIAIDEIWRARDVARYENNDHRYAEVRR